MERRGSEAPGAAHSATDRAKMDPSRAMPVAETGVSQREKPCAGGGEPVLAEHGAEGAGPGLAELRGDSGGPACEEPATGSGSPGRAVPEAEAEGLSRAKLRSDMKVPSRWAVETGSEGSRQERLRKDKAKPGL